MDGEKPAVTDATLTQYLLGKLTPEEHSAVEKQLDECPTAWQLASQMQPQDELTRLLNDASTAEVDEKYRHWQDAFNSQLSFEISASICHADTSIGLPGRMDEIRPPLLLETHPRYRLLRLLGTGGMGRVWLAEHMVMGRQVALKVMRTGLLSDRLAVERFLREVQAAAKLNHPNIASAYDAENLDDTLLLVMEFVPGRTLAEIVRDAPLSVAEACRAIRDAAAGLAHAHAAGLVHRDVKPGNLIRAPDGTVKVLDFGLAFSADSDSSITGKNLVMGTPDYIAPEQAEDPHSADVRSDIYSLGCTMYHLLSGRAPFAGALALKKLDAQRHSEPPPLSDCPGLLVAVVSKMMAKDPAARYESASDIVAEMDRWLSGTMPQDSVIRPPEESEPTAATFGRGRHTLALATVPVLIAVAGWLTVKNWPSNNDAAELPDSNSEQIEKTASETQFGPKSLPNNTVADKSDPALQGVLSVVPLLSPSSFADGSPLNIRLEGSILHIDSITGADQVWLDYTEFEAEEIDVTMQFRMIEMQNEGCLKIAFVHQNVPEFNLQIIRNDSESTLVIERADTELTNLSAESLPVGFGRELTALRFVIKDKQLTAFVNGEERLTAVCDSPAARCVAICARHCKVEIHDPKATMRIQIP